VKPEELHRVSHLLERQTAEIEARKALGRYFQNACSALRPFPVPDELLAPPESSRATGAALKVARERMLALAPEYRAAFRAYDEADTTYLNAARAAAVHASGAKFDGRKLDIEARSSDEARAAGKEARQAMDDAAPRLAPFEAAASERFWSALRLVHVAKVRERLAGDDGLVKGMSAFASALHLTTRLSSELIRLRDKMIAFAAVCSCIEGNEQRSSLIEALQSRSRELRRMLQELYGQLASAPYPFDSAREGMTLRDHVFPVDDGPPVPESDDIASMLHAARRAYESMLGLHLRLSARLAERAEQIESLLGLPPLPEVPEEPGAEAPSDFAESE
jgi:hypothetical protein